jgi:hypothetical protein
MEPHCGAADSFFLSLKQKSVIYFMMNLECRKRSVVTRAEKLRGKAQADEAHIPAEGFISGSTSAAEPTKKASKVYLAAAQCIVRIFQGSKYGLLVQGIDGGEIEPNYEFPTACRVTEGFAGPGGTRGAVGPRRGLYFALLYGTAYQFIGKALHRGFVELAGYLEQGRL